MAIHADNFFQSFTNFTLIKRPFSELSQGLAEHNINAIDGLLLDLGVSSPQLDVAERGFSFRQDGPLDMRMDYTSGEPVSVWLAEATHQEIARVLRVYGDESDALAIASAIVENRKHTPFTRTSQLADIVVDVKKRSSRTRRKRRNEQKKPVHAATKTFQALRIYIGGRLCVISFHSLEDRMVKRFMRDHSRVDPELANLPEVPDSLKPKLRLVGKAIHATKQEIQGNPRSRSAVLRVAERLADVA